MKRNPEYKKLGTWLIVAGIAGIVLAVIISFTIYSEMDKGGLPAMSFLVLMIGMAFCFPSMLEENPGEISTMRIIVFSVTMIFCVIYFKTAWASGTFQKLSIDDSWIYILGLAFGSKALQKFGEESNNGKEEEEEEEK